MDVPLAHDAAHKVGSGRWEALGARVEGAGEGAKLQRPLAALEQPVFQTGSRSLASFVHCIVHCSLNAAYEIQSHGQTYRPTSSSTRG